MNTELTDATIAFEQVKAAAWANYNAWLAWSHSPGRKPDDKNAEWEARYQFHKAAALAAANRLEKAGGIASFR
jgi:hypothetical protein